METGVAIFPTHVSLDPGAVARLIEERGYESLFLPEHSHLPADRRSLYHVVRAEKYVHTGHP